MDNILITGANRGIGLELVVQNLDKGNQVWGSYRNASNSQELIELSNTNNMLKCFQMDVKSEPSVIESFRIFEAKNLKFDIIFNNSGIIDWSDFAKVKAISFAEVYQVNVIGCFLVIRNAINCLHQNSTRKSRIINISSRLGSISLRGNTQLGGALAYQCSKAALNMLTKQTSLELSSKGISIISMSPGWVKTEMGGKDAKYEKSDAVGMMLEVIDSLNPDETGIFIGEDKTIIPW